MKIIILIVAFIALSGCATMKTQSEVDNIRTWAFQELPKAKSGEVKWSDYYTTLHDKFKPVEMLQNKGFILEILALSIDASIAYEKGKISQDEFKSFQRKSNAQYEQIEEATRLRNQQAASNAINQYLQNQVLINSDWQARQPIYCNSTQFGNTVKTQCN